MKKILYTITLTLVCGLMIGANAQEIARRPPKNYLNLNYVIQKQDFVKDLVPEGKSDMGAAFVMGHTYYVTKPLLGMLSVGLDWTYLDINYASYKIGSTKSHAGEFGMHFGPSVTVNPLGKLDCRAYFRWAPTYSAFFVNSGDGIDLSDLSNINFDNLSIAGGFTSAFVAGASVGYGFITFGVESRWGNCKYKEIKVDSEDIGSTDIGKKAINTTRIYLGFRW